MRASAEMVLSNSSSNSDDFNDVVPASDNDPYTTNPEDPSQTPSRIALDLRNLPRPIPIFGPLFGFNKQLYEKVLKMRATEATKVLGRPITQDEAQALAYYSAKQISITSYGGPLGMFAAIFRAHQTRELFRFPFWQPNLEEYKFDSILGIKGPRATQAWHLVRAAMYGIVGNFVGRIIIASYAVSVASVGELRDPRLKEYVDRIRTNVQGTVGGATRGPHESGIIDGAGHEDAPTLRRHNQEEQADDASPTGGSYADEALALAKDGFATDAQVAAEEARSTSSQEHVRKPSPQDRFRPRQKAIQEIDDASPSGGMGLMGDDEPAAAPTGSAWDRIRQQQGVVGGTGGQRGSSWPSGRAQPQQNGAQNAWTRPHAEQHGSSTMGDNFAFSKTDEERQTAKTEAQREFDERVERERRGGDFTSGSGDQRRW